MTKLPQIKPQDLIKLLERHGFQTTRISGSHARLVHKDGRKATIKSIIRQAKISLTDLKS